MHHHHIWFDLLRCCYHSDIRLCGRGCGCRSCTDCMARCLIVGSNPPRMTTNLLLAHRPFASEASTRSIGIALDFPFPVAEATMWTQIIWPIVLTTIAQIPEHGSLLTHVTIFDVLATLWTFIGLCLAFFRTKIVGTTPHFGPCPH